MKTRWNVAYDTPDGVRIYCIQWSSKEIMEAQLVKWKSLYGEKGGKIYPNGKGYYPFSNPRLVCKG